MNSLIGCVIAIAAVRALAELAMRWPTRGLRAWLGLRATAMHPKGEDDE